MLPAHAGMVPGRRRRRPQARRAPRARGDGPRQRPRWRPHALCSPRTRGWSPVAQNLWLPSRVLPAHAGMVPMSIWASRASIRAPRARGDGPARYRGGRRYKKCSPRTRGWSPPLAVSLPIVRVLPAHAGMVPATKRSRLHLLSAPRARGDGPLAHPGRPRPLPCSPRTRGWSLPALRAEVRFPVLPAHAGMVPSLRSRRAHRPSAPRARGDGPGPSGSVGPARSCSPRTRGWSPGQAVQG